MIQAIRPLKIVWCLTAIVIFAQPIKAMSKEKFKAALHKLLIESDCDQLDPESDAYTKCLRDQMLKSAGIGYLLSFVIGGGLLHFKGGSLDDYMIPAVVGVPAFLGAASAFKHTVLRPLWRKIRDTNMQKNAEHQTSSMTDLNTESTRGAYSD